MVSVVSCWSLAGDQDLKRWRSKRWYGMVLVYVREQRKGEGKLPLLFKRLRSVLNQRPQTAGTVLKHMPTLPQNFEDMYSKVGISNSRFQKMASI